MLSQSIPIEISRVSYEHTTRSIVGFSLIHESYLCPNLPYTSGYSPGRTNGRSNSASVAMQIAGTSRSRVPMGGGDEYIATDAEAIAGRRPYRYTHRKLVCPLWISHSAYRSYCAVQNQAR